mgnify:CR=1 FL=1
MTRLGLTSALATALLFSALSALPAHAQVTATDLLVRLDQLEKQLKESDLTGIPDTGVSLQSLQENKVQLQRAVIELKKARTKKTVRL